jgi:YHS domain-containing protein
VRALALAAVVVLHASALIGCAAQGPDQRSAPAQELEQAFKVVDPVCGMQIDPAKAAGKSDYKGKTYYFCSDNCKKTFDANSEAVLNKASKRM